MKQDHTLAALPSGLRGQVKHVIRRRVAHRLADRKPVPEGTNAMAIEGGADILAHPGLIGAKLARRAARRGVALELSARKGHCLANGLVAAVATAAGARLVVNTDAHAPGDLITREMAARVARGAGLAERAVRSVFSEAERFARRLASD